MSRLHLVGLMPEMGFRVGEGPVGWGVVDEGGKAEEDGGGLGAVEEGAEDDGGGFGVVEEGPEEAGGEFGLVGVAVVEGVGDVFVETSLPGIVEVGLGLVDEGGEAEEDGGGLGVFEEGREEAGGGFGFVGLVVEEGVGDAFVGTSVPGVVEDGFGLVNELGGAG